MNTFSRSDVGRRLAQIRGQESHQDFAARLGVHKNTYGGYERGQSELGAEAIFHLVSAGWNANWVLTGEGPERLAAPDRLGEQRATYGSQPVRADSLTIAIGLAEEALVGRKMSPENKAELIALIYDLVEEGMPEAKVLKFVKAASA